ILSLLNYHMLLQIYTHQHCYTLFLPLFLLFYLSIVFFLLHLRFLLQSTSFSFFISFISIFKNNYFYFFHTPINTLFIGVHTNVNLIGVLSHSTTCIKGFSLAISLYIKFSSIRESVRIYCYCSPVWFSSCRCYIRIAIIFNTTFIIIR